MLHTPDDGIRILYFGKGANGGNSVNVHIVSGHDINARNNINVAGTIVGYGGLDFKRLYTLLNCAGHTYDGVLQHHLCMKAVMELFIMILGML
jgi:hypothetical protein